MRESRHAPPTYVRAAAGAEVKARRSGFGGGNGHARPNRRVVKVKGAAPAAGTISSGGEAPPARPPQCRQPCVDWSRGSTAPSPRKWASGARPDAADAFLALG